MATTLQDVSQAWRDYVLNTMVATVTTTGVPTGEKDFNPKEKVRVDVSVTNGTTATGIEVKDVRLHLKAIANPDKGVFKFIVPDANTGITAFSSETSTTPLTALSEQAEMYIEKSALKRLSAGAKVNIDGQLEVVGKNVGTEDLSVDVHASLDLDKLFPPHIDGKNVTKSLTVTT